MVPSTSVYRIRAARGIVRFITSLARRARLDWPFLGYRSRCGKRPCRHPVRSKVLVSVPSIDSRLTDVFAEKICDCPFSIAQEYAEVYLKKAEAGGVESFVRVPLAWPFSLARRVALSFTRASDLTEPGRAHDQLVLRWASGVALLPNFRGTVRFRVDGRRTTVRIDGTYNPPLGKVGAALDRFVGKRIARRSVGDLLSRIVRSLERQQLEWLRRQPVADAR
jgi:hypothetical protein